MKRHFPYVTVWEKRGAVLSSYYYSNSNRRIASRELVRDAKQLKLLIWNNHFEQGLI